MRELEGVRRNEKVGGATGKRELESGRRGGRTKGTKMEEESGQAKEIKKKE